VEPTVVISTILSAVILYLITTELWLFVHQLQQRQMMRVAGPAARLALRNRIRLLEAAVRARP
jgi:hypothetical protein